MHNTGAEDRDQWRERIIRALKDLKSDEAATAGRMRDQARDDASAESAKL